MKTINPQPENGHIDIANEIAEALMKVNLSPYEYRILWAIWRKTYGWHKKKDRISITQFQKMTGLKRRHVSRALKSLIHKNIVTRTGDNRFITYGFQKDYTKWRDVTFIGTPSPKQVTICHLNRCLQKKLLKENNINITCVDFEKSTQDNSQASKEEESLSSLNSGNGKLTPEDIHCLYKKLCPNLPQIRELTRERRTKVLARIKTYPELEFWREVFEKANQSYIPPTDGHPRGWKPDFDFLIRNDTNPIKIIEEKFIQKPKFSW